MAIYDPRVEKMQAASAVLGVPKKFYDYLPPGYALSTNRRYPALYRFRGHEVEWINKNQDPGACHALRDAAFPSRVL